MHVLLVDDHAVVRRGLSLLLQGTLGQIDIVEASDADGAIAEIEKKTPDLLISDISLAGSNGIELTKQIAARWPEIPILIVSMHDEELYAERALRAGAMGFVMKREPDDVLMDAVRGVLDGRVFVGPTARGRILMRMVDRDAGRSPLDGLSDRELEVFEHMGHGASRLEIARLLNVADKTVDSYRSRMKQKLGLDTTTQLVQMAVQWVQDSGK